MDEVISRRQLIQVGGAVMAGAVFSSPPRVNAAQVVTPASTAQRSRVLRLAHLTDFHVQPERGAEAGLAAALQHAQALKDAPALILAGGDLIMDSSSQDEARTRVQWDIWQRGVKQECSLPIRSCIGNHDVWGLNKANSKTDGTEPLWGKKWAMDVLGLSQRYYAFDQAGWHFIVLDSTFPVGDGYTGKLDETQFAWLADDLAKVDPKTPVLILSHIPILSAAVFLDGENEKTGNWSVPGAWMHIDLRRIKDLFLKHPNVKLCLSGHLHLADRVDYNGVTYLCNGAVCGGWWKGNYHECEEGYGVIDLFSDGTFDHQYVGFGWEPRA